MKYSIHRLLLVICLVAANSFCYAQSGEVENRLESQREDEVRPSKKTLLLHSLLRMSPEELAELRQTIERIEAMPEEEREAIRQRIAQLEKMDPEKVDRLRKRFEAIPKEKRKVMRERWFAMSQEERDEWRRKLREMSPEERAELVATEGFLPSPPGSSGRGPKKGPPPPGGPRRPE
ncbi:MAG: DUF3106 domain-containing protein [Verrucomicrobiota bacterium]